VGVLAKITDKRSTPAANHGFQKKHKRKLLNSLKGNKFPFEK
jgi:hypothetical protein